MRYATTLSMVAALSALGSLAQEAGAQNQPNRFNQSGTRIVSGKKTDIKLHPWQVAIDIKIGKEEQFCGGSIIEPLWVLTAAHCFFNEAGDKRAKAGEVRVKSGVTNYASKNGVWSKVERLEINTDYNPAPDSDNQHDIALIKLAPQPAGKTIELASPSLNIPNGQELEVTGWGETAFGRGDGLGYLLKAEVPYQLPETCNAPESYKGAVKAGMLCAGFRDGGVDACRGDSGGPLVWRTKKEGKEDDTVLVGVVSWGSGCARRLKYGIYTRVSAYREWTSKILASDGK